MKTELKLFTQSDLLVAQLIVKPAIIITLNKDQVTLTIAEYLAANSRVLKNMPLGLLQNITDVAVLKELATNSLTKPMFTEHQRMLMLTVTADKYGAATTRLLLNKQIFNAEMTPYRFNKLLERIGFDQRENVLSLFLLGVTDTQLNVAFNCGLALADVVVAASEGKDPVKFISEVTHCSFDP